MTASSPLIDMQDVTKIYCMGKTEVQALGGISLSIAQGEYVAVVGASGSGKSTLMNIVGLLDGPQRVPIASGSRMPRPSRTDNWQTCATEKSDSYSSSLICWRVCARFWGTPE